MHHPNAQLDECIVGYPTNQSTGRVVVRWLGLASIGLAVVVVVEVVTGECLMAVY